MNNSKEGELTRIDYHDHDYDHGISSSKSLFDTDTDVDTDVDTDTETDVDTDLPPLADASDCDTIDTISTCSDQDCQSKNQNQHSHKHVTATRVTSSTTSVGGYLQSKKSLPSLTYSDSIDVDSMKAQGSQGSLPPPSFSKSISTSTSTSKLSPSNQLSSCASLFCISELFSSWDDGNDNDDNDATATLATETVPQQQQQQQQHPLNIHIHDDTNTNNAHSNTHAQDAYRYLHTMQSTIQNEILALISTNTNMAKRIIPLAFSNLCCPNHDHDHDAQQQQQGKNGTANGSAHQHSYGQMQQYQQHQQQHQQQQYQMQRIGNRNVHQREKARKRIEALRESGLSKNFSLRSIYDIHGETVSASSATGHDHGHGHPHGHPHISKKTGASTFYSRSGRGRIGSSKSIDWSGGDSHGHRHQYQGKDSSGYFLGCNDSNGNGRTRAHTRTRTRMNGNSKQMLVAVPSFDSMASEVELYYDSDPGPETRKTRTTSTASAGMKKGTKKKECIDTASAGQCAKGKKEEHSSSKMFLHTYHVPSFDINNARMVSQLISVRYVTSDQMRAL